MPVEKAETNGVVKENPAVTEIVSKLPRPMNQN
jgi:hypothetical protein